MKAREFSNIYDILEKINFDKKISEEVKTMKDMPKIVYINLVFGHIQRFYKELLKQACKQEEQEQQLKEDNDTTNI